MIQSFINWFIFIVQVPSDRIPFETQQELWHKDDHSSRLVYCLPELRSPCMQQCPQAERSMSQLAQQMMAVFLAVLSSN